MPQITRPVSRRTTLAAAPLLLVASCRWGPEDDAAPQATPKAGETPPVLLSDGEQVAAAGRAIDTVVEFVSAVSAAHVGLSTPLADLVSLHVEHLALLETERVGPGKPSVPNKSGNALTAVRRRERSLQKTLAALANEVSSGTLARTLASMAAGVAQRTELLPASPKDGDA